MRKEAIMSELVNNRAQTEMPFTLAEYSEDPPCVCPACGGSMLPAQYFLAFKGDQTYGQQSTIAGEMKTITTRYYGIREKTGALCPNCYTKRLRPSQNNSFLLSGVFGFFRSHS